MTKKSYRVSELAKLAGVTVRTLHHYDEIGLLMPSARSDAGYRIYEEEDLLRLQQILIQRALGLPLEKIRSSLDATDEELREILLDQRSQLESRREDLESMISSIDQALRTLEGEETDMKDLFHGFDPKQYEDEVSQRWGGTAAYAESQRRTSGYKKEDWSRLSEESKDILQRLAALMEAGEPPTGEKAVSLAEEHRLHIDRWFYPCDRPMHRNLADLYVGDARFKKSFEAQAEGLAEYLVEAIRANSN